MLEVVTDDAIRAESDQGIEGLREAMNAEGIVFRQASRVEDDRFQFVGVDPDRDADVRRIFRDQLPEWNLVSTSGVANTYVLELDSATQAVYRDLAVTQAIQTIRNRIDSLGVTEPVIQEYGGAGRYEILVQLPGVDDPGRVKTIMQSTALLELKLVATGPFGSQQAALGNYGGALPLDLQAVRSVEADLTAGGAEAWYVVESVAAITGRDLKNAYQSRDENGRPAVTFGLTVDGSQRFGRVTEQNVGRAWLSSLTAESSRRRRSTAASRNRA